MHKSAGMSETKNNILRVGEISTCVGNTHFTKFDVGGVQCWGRRHCSAIYKSIYYIM